MEANSIAWEIGIGNPYPGKVKKKVLQINSNTRSVKIEFFSWQAERERESRRARWVYYLYVDYTGEGTRKRWLKKLGTIIHLLQYNLLSGEIFWVHQKLFGEREKRTFPMLIWHEVYSNLGLYLLDHNLDDEYYSLDGCFQCIHIEKDCIWKRCIQYNNQRIFTSS